MICTRLALRCAAVLALAVCAGTGLLAQSSVPRRVIEKIDETKTVALRGHVRAEANAANDRGPVADSAELGHVILLLRRTDAQQKALDARVDQLHNPNSEQYHKWLTPEQFGEEFGPADEDVAAVRHWLESKGFIIEDLPPSKTHITFTGTVGQLRQAFHADVHHLSVNGEAHQAVMHEPSIPAAVAPVVSGFRQLHDFNAKPLYHPAGAFKVNKQTGEATPVEGTEVAPRFDLTFNYGGYTYRALGPQDFYTVYNENPLLTAGITGAGVTIGVIEEVMVTQADIATFRSQFGLAAYPATPNATRGGVNWLYGAASGLGGDTACKAPDSISTAKTDGEEGEALLDTEWAGAVAPNAIIDFVSCGTKRNAIGSYGTDLAAEHVVNYLSSTIAATSLSYGECETAAGSTGAAFYSNLWQQFAAQGITAVVSSGDAGSMGCDQSRRYAINNPSTNAMSSTAYNISAGGTDFADAYISDDYATSPATTWWNNTDGTGYSSAKSYIPEITWGGYCSSGLSASFLQKNGVTTFGTTYTPEAICNNSIASNDGYRAVAGASGGFSQFNARPSFQSVYGVGLDSSSTTFRNEPDISFFAASGFWGHLLPYCESDVKPCVFSNGTDAVYLGAGGTSFVAPQVSGLMALVNQATNSRQGQADYTLYAKGMTEYGIPSAPNTSSLSACSGSAKGATVGSSCIFRDIAADTPSLQGGTIASDIVQPCKYASVTDCYRTVGTDTYGLSAITGASHSSTLSYYAGAGYDVATGLGSANIYNLVTKWNSATTSYASATLLTPISSTVSYGGNETLTATVVAVGRGASAYPAGNVQFYLGSTSGTPLGSIPMAASCAGIAPNPSCSGVALFSVSGSSLQPGANSIVGYFGGDASGDAASTSTAQTVTVNNWPQNITFNIATPVTYGAAPITLSATSDSGLTPTFQYISGPATLNGNTLTITGAGQVLVEADQAGNSIYASASLQQLLTVNKADANCNVTGYSVTYDGSAHAATGSCTGVNNEPLIVPKGSTAKSMITAVSGLDLSQTAHTNAGNYSDPWTFTDSTGNYNNTGGNVPDTINRATATVVVTPYNTTYNAVAQTATVTSITGVNGETGAAVGIVDVSGTTHTEAGTYSDSWSFTSAGNYNNIGSAPITDTIGQADPGCSVTAVLGLLYNGSAQTTLQGSCTGVAGGATPSHISVRSRHGVKHFNVTTGCNPTSGGLDLSCASHTDAGSFSDNWAYNDTTGDYTNTSGSVPTSIGQAPLSVTVDSQMMTFGGTVPTLTGTLTGVLGTDGITASFGTIGTSASPAGTYPITATLNDPNSKLGDYSVTNTPSTLTINQAVPIVSWSTPAAITYGTGLGATQQNATANVAGTFIYNPAAGTVLSVGYHKINVTFTPTDAIDYTMATAAVLIQVTKQATSITWATPSSIVYGTTLDVTQLNASVNGGVPGTLTYTPAAGTLLTAGTHKLNVTFTPADPTSYTSSTSSVLLAVTRQTPVITWAAPASIVYGTALDTTQQNATANVAGTFGYTPAAGTVLTAGTRKLNVTFTPADSNYSTVTSSMVLVVTKANPAITWATPASIAYGTALDATQQNATANVAGTFTYTPAAGAVLTAGTRKLNVTFTPTDTTDYSAASASVTLVVAKATPTITWAAPAPISHGTVLDATQQNATANVAGTFTYTPAAGTVEGVGSHTLSVKFVPTDTVDYTNATATVTLQVNP